MSNRNIIAGRTVGPYKILEFVGRGGMGEVYAAEHMSMKRKVALKFLNADVLPDSDAAKRFAREAQIAARLSHPNIVPIYDFKASEFGYFIAMELVVGKPLSEEIRSKGTLRQEVVLGIVHDVARALAHAHESGIIHRDIKPDNIMLCEDGTVKVLDFGLAKAIDATTKITKTGSALGTPYYMSPEQCRSVELDPRTDIYSLGVVAFEALSGKRPYHGNTPIDVMMQISKAPFPPLRSVAHSATRGIEAVVANMTEKEPDDRYSSCQEVVEDIEKMTVSEDFVPPRRNEGVVAAALDLSFEEDANESAFKASRIDVKSGINWTGTVLGAITVVGLTALGVYWIFPNSPDQPPSVEQANVVGSPEPTPTPEIQETVVTPEETPPKEYGLNRTFNPFTIGSKWVYAVEDGSRFELEIVEAKRIRGRTVFVANGRNTTHGSMNVIRHYMVTNNGLYVYEGWNLDEPWTTLEFPMAVGDRWMSQSAKYNFHKEFHVESEVELEVPAGRFTCVKIDSGFFAAHPTAENFESRWWNPDVGFVKLNVLYNWEGDKVVAELESFSRG